MEWCLNRVSSSQLRLSQFPVCIRMKSQDQIAILMKQRVCRDGSLVDSSVLPCYIPDWQPDCTYCQLYCTVCVCTCVAPNYQRRKHTVLEYAMGPRCGVLKTAQHIFSSTFNLGELCALALQLPAGSSKFTCEVGPSGNCMCSFWQVDKWMFHYFIFMFPVHTHRSLQLSDDYRYIM